MIPYRLLRAVLYLIPIALISGCSPYHRSGGDAATWEYRFEKQAQMAADRFRHVDPSINRFFDSAVGYAVFPNVTKAAVGIGGAHGAGVVFQGDEIIGHATLVQASVGVALGGQTYSEIIFFESLADLDVFKQSNLHFSAEASVVILKHGAGAKADYDSGVAVYVSDMEGLMLDASIGGQKFKFQSK
jgi:lipid-binding SYLF domain-containing protein